MVNIKIKSVSQIKFSKYLIKNIKEANLCKYKSIPPPISCTNTQSLPLAAADKSEKKLYQYSNIKHNEDK